MLNLITISECIRIVNINTKTNDHKCIIHVLTNGAYTMLNLITINPCIYKYKCIQIVNINFKANNHTCMILTNRAYTMYRYTICTLFVAFSSSLCEFQSLLRAPATKCPCNETTGDEVSPQRNGGRQSVPVMKWQATMYICDEMAGNEVYPRQNILL